MRAETESEQLSRYNYQSAGNTKRETCLVTQYDAVGIILTMRNCKTNIMQLLQDLQEDGGNQVKQNNKNELPCLDGIQMPI